MSVFPPRSLGIGALHSSILTSGLTAEETGVAVIAVAAASLGRRVLSSVMGTTVIAMTALLATPTTIVRQRKEANFGALRIGASSTW